MTNFAPLARSYVTTTYPTLSRTSAFPLPSDLSQVEQVWSFLGDAEDAVFAKANEYLAARTRLTSAQKNAYASLRTAWNNAQRNLYAFMRDLFFLRFPSAQAQQYSAAIPFPGWLPKIDASSLDLPLSPDMRDDTGKRMGIAGKGAEVVTTITVQNDTVSFSLDVNPDRVRSICGDIYAVGLLAATMPRPGTAAARTSSTTSVLTAATGEMNARHGSSKLVMYALAGVAALGLFYWFVIRPAPKRGVRGLGSPTRLKALDDKVPSRYGLEVD